MQADGCPRAWPGFDQAGNLFCRHVGRQVRRKVGIVGEETRFAGLKSVQFCALCNCGVVWPSGCDVFSRYTRSVLWLHSISGEARAFKGLLVQGNQFVKKYRNTLFRVTNQLQALAHRDQEGGDQLHQARAVAPRQAQLHAPQQIVHEREVAVRIAGTVRAAQLRLGHDLGPGSAQEGDDQLGHVLVFDLRMEIFREALCQQVALLGVQELAHTLFMLFAQDFLIPRPALFELAQHPGEGGGIAVAASQYPHGIGDGFGKNPKTLI